MIEIHYLMTADPNPILQQGANLFTGSMEWAGDAMKVWAAGLGAVGIIAYFFSAAKE
jgi:hypothetical protein